MKKLKFTKSLSFRFISLSLAMCVALYAITMVCSGMLYSSVLEDRYANLCKTVSRVVSGCVNADNINIWLNGEDTHGYIQATNRLEELNNNTPDLECIAIYQMRDDGMYTVYNTNSTLPRRNLGNVVSYDSKWGAYKSNFLAGENVDKIFVSGYNGQTMTYCTPIFDSDNQCVAYVCSGISMSSIQNELAAFLNSLGAALLVITASLYLLIYIYIRAKVLKPSKQVSLAMLNPLRKGSVELMRMLATIPYYSTRDMKHIFKSASKVFAEKNGITTINREQQREVMRAFATIISRSNLDMELYKDHTSECTRLLCEELKKNDDYSEVLTPEFCKYLEIAMPLRDIGKLTVPDEVIYKPDKLTADEFEIIKNHSQNGAVIIEKTKKTIHNKKYLAMAHEIALYHHEHWDGSGYPEKLKGEEIPLSARITAIIDAYDAITRKCCYHSAHTPDKAYEILLADEGYFDPEILKCFVNIKDKIIENYN